MKKSRLDAMARYAQSYGDLSGALFASRFCALTKRVREEAGLSELEVAQALGVDVLEYQTYETSAYLPFRILGQFCGVVGVNADEMFRAVMIKAAAGDVASVIASKAAARRRRVRDSL